MTREAAYGAYCRVYNAFMAGSHSSIEEVETAANTVRTASAAYRAACAAEEAMESVEAYEAEVRMHLVLEVGMMPCDHPLYRAYAAAVRKVFNSPDYCQADIEAMQSARVSWQTYFITGV